MKRLIILGLVLIAKAFAQTAPDERALGANLELDFLSYGNTHILPVTINISKYIDSSASRNLDNITVEELEVALAQVSGVDIYNEDIGGSSRLMATGNLGFLSLKRKQFFLKGEQAQYNIISFMDASVGAIASIGGEFFIEVDLFVDMAAKRSYENDQLFKITHEEFEEYLQSSQCANCSNSAMTGGREENATILDYQQLFPRYGAGVKMRYKRLKMSLYKKSYTTNYLSGLLVANNEGNFHWDRRFLDKKTLITEVKFEIAYEALRSKTINMDVFASYAITAFTSTTAAHFETEVMQASGDYDFETEVTPISEIESPGLGDRSLLRAGLRIRIK